MIQEFAAKKALEAVFRVVEKRLAASGSALAGSPTESDRQIEHHVRFVKNWCAELSFSELRSPKGTSDTYVPLDLYVQPRRVRMDSRESLDLVPFESLFIVPMRRATTLEQPEKSASIRHLVILGQPGAGKTTSMKHLCHKMLTDDGFPDSRYSFPLVVRLRDLNVLDQSQSGGTSKAGRLFRRLSTILGIDVRWADSLDEDARGEALARTVTEVLDSLQPIVVLDGFDELSNKAARESIIQDVRTLTVQLERSLLVLTCRTGDFAYDLTHARQYELSPLSKDQVQTLVTRWLGDGPRASAIFSEISHSPYADAALRPLTIAHLCAIYERAGRIPDKPKTVYKKVVNLLLEEWDEQRSVKRGSAYAEFEVERKFEFLCNLAYYLTINVRRSSFEKKHLASAYTRIHENFGLPRADAKRVADELESHTGLFLQAGYELYEFAHKSLQEFLTAEYLVRLPALPENPTHLMGMPNEVAIAVAISSNPSEYFTELVFSRIRKVRRLPITFVQPFVSRLLVEKPDFPHSATLGTALLTLYSEYLASVYRTDKQLELFAPSDLGAEFDALASMIRSNLVVPEVLALYEERGSADTSDGMTVTVFVKSTMPAGATPQVARLHRLLPSALRLRGSFLEHSGRTENGVPSDGPFGAYDADWNGDEPASPEVEEFLDPAGEGAK